MAEPPIPPLPPPSPPSIMPMLYYSLIIIATVAGLLAVYNLIIMKCGHNYSSSAADRISRAPTSGSITSFKYKSDGGGGGANIDNECSVCLSVFEEGDELKQLPNCKHRFHAPCIDMWLYSRTSCPLCRTTVAVAVAVAAAAPAMIHPREALVGPAVMV